MKKMIHLAVAISGMASLLPAQNLPDGFIAEPFAVLPGGTDPDKLLAPMGFDFLPDGRLVFVEQAGKVKVVVQGTAASIGQVPEQLLNLTVSYSRGLISVAVDPDWPSRPYLYFWYNHRDATGETMRLAMYTAEGDLTDARSANLALGSAHLVLADIPDMRAEHNGGALRFGPDGMLYLSVGDDHMGGDAQDLSVLRGKILRLDVAALPGAGSGPPPRSQIVPTGNPHTGPDDNARLVWAHGLRNPFRFHIDPQNGALFISDQGEGEDSLETPPLPHYDEINWIEAGGANLGWPWFEANSPTDGFEPVVNNLGGTAPTDTVFPIATEFLTQTTPARTFTALISMEVYRAPAGSMFDFGPDYAGDYFYTDHFSGRVWRLEYDGNSWAPASPAPGQVDPDHWATDLTNIVDGRVGPEGALYYIKRKSRTTADGGIFRIRPDAGFGTLSETAGCPGPGGVPTLAPAPGALPWVGEPFTIMLSNLSASHAPFGVLGFSNTQLFGTDPLPLDLSTYGPLGPDNPFGPGCFLYVDLGVSIPLVNQSGTATWTLQVPADPSLAGLSFYTQGVLLDLSAGTALMTNAAEGLIGAR